MGLITERKRDNGVATLNGICKYFVSGFGRAFYINLIYTPHAAHKYHDYHGPSKRIQSCISTFPEQEKPCSELKQVYFSNQQ